LRTAAHDNNATILVVAHDARIIAHVDRVFQLEDGTLVETEHESAAERQRLSRIDSKHNTPEPAGVSSDS